MSTTRRLPLLVLALLVVAAVHAQDYAPPYLRLTKLTQPPTIDGVIDPAEYAGVPAITGMVTWGGPGGPDKSVVAHVQQVVWYLGYDDKYLYISMHSPHPKGTWPAARIKERDHNRILWDDHTEIQITTRGRRNFSAPGKGFYKIMNNAKGAVHDAWYYNGTPGTENDWAIGGQYKATVTDTAWDMEMSILLEGMRAENIDGQTWVMQLLRADAPGGVYFAGWVGETWMSWGQFGDVQFDPTAPAFRFLDAGELAKGKVDMTFQVVGKTAPATVAVEVSARDPQGNELYRQRLEKEVPVGQTVTFNPKGEVAWAEGHNWFAIHATMTRPNADGQPETVRLYDVEMPVKTLVPATEWAARVEPWLTQKPKSGDPDWTFAYWPYYGVAEAAVDVDFFGMAPAVTAAGSFRIEAVRDDKVVAANTAPMAEMKGHMVVKTGELPAGEYLARISLLDGAGKVVYTNDRPFRRQVYEWEHNTIGEEDILLPVFDPVGRADDRALTVYARRYEIGANGLPAQIVAGEGAGPEALLAGLVQFVATVGGKPVSPAIASDIAEVTDTRARVTGSGTLAGANVQVAAELMYDGFYDVTVTLEPGAAPVTFDRLSLEIPVWAAADTLYIQRGSDTVAGGNYLGAIPPGDGVVWSSDSLLPVPDQAQIWGSFAPVAYAGTGDKGVWYFCDENRDWTMADDVPALEIVRQPDAVLMRLNVFAAPTKLDRARRLHFAILADPVKHMSDQRKVGWNRQAPARHGWYAHCTFGWRWWGRSADGYWTLPEDRVALRDVLQGKRPPGRPLGAFRDSAIACVRRSLPVTLYGSGKNSMVDLPSFDTFGGEWLGKSFIPGDEMRAKSGGMNIGGTYEFLRVREMEEVALNWAQSQVDCFMYWHEKLLRDCPVNGTWWDNRSSYTIKEWDPERQEFYYRWNTWMRRQLGRRLNTLGWTINRRPWWINNLHMDWSFNQVSWHIENDYYIDGPTNTLLDQMTMDQFRAYTRLKRGIIHRLASRYSGNEPATQHERKLQARNLIGLCLLHDIGAYQWAQYYAGEYERLPALLEEYVGFFGEEKDCPFTGYWRSGDLVQVQDPLIYVSVYKGRDRAVLVVMNGHPEPADARFEITQKLLGRRPTAVYDAETGIQFREYGWRDPETGRGYRLWGEYDAGVFDVDRHGLRMIVVE